MAAYPKKGNTKMPSYQAQEKRQEQRPVQVQNQNPNRVPNQASQPIVNSCYYSMPQTPPTQGNAVVQNRRNDKSEYVTGYPSLQYVATSASTGSGVGPANGTPLANPNRTKKVRPSKQRPITKHRRKSKNRHSRKPNASNSDSISDKAAEGNTKPYPTRKKERRKGRHQRSQVGDRLSEQMRQKELKKEMARQRAEEVNVLRNALMAINRQNTSKTIVRMEKGDTVVSSENMTWHVKTVIGAGEFGYVYLVEGGNNERKEHALKTEMRYAYKGSCRISQELNVLQTIFEHVDEEHQKHFLRLVDKGRTDEFNFIVMELAGPCLLDIRNKFLEGRFSKATALNIAMQTFEAIQNIHNYGFVHRDITPENFVVGLNHNESVVYIIDFGICRAIYNVTVKDKKQIKTMKEFQSKTQPFMGTVRFASRASHYGTDQGRKDDLESWIYMVYDIFDNEKGLPWKRDDHRREVVKCKQALFRHEYESCYENVPQKMSTILDYISELEFKDEPNYSMVGSILQRIGNELDLNWKAPPDWVGKLPKKESNDKKPSSQLVLKKCGEIDDSKSRGKQEDREDTEDQDEDSTQSQTL